MRLEVPLAVRLGSKSADPAASAPTRSTTQCLESAVIVIASGRISTAC